MMQMNSYLRIHSYSSSPINSLLPIITSINSVSYLMNFLNHMWIPVSVTKLLSMSVYRIFYHNVRIRRWIMNRIAWVKNAIYTDILILAPKHACSRNIFVSACMKIFIIIPKIMFNYFIICKNNKMLSLDYMFLKLLLTFFIF